MRKQLAQYLICLLLMAVTIAGILSLSWEEENDYRLANTENLTYVKAKVLSIESENLAADSLEPDKLVGTQQITVEILSGELKGEEVSLTNYMTRSLNVYTSVGMTIMICVDAPDNADNYYTVYSYYRTPGLILILAFFAAIVIAVGRSKGVWSLLGLAYTVFVVLFFTVQAIFHGVSPMLAVIATVGAASLFSLWLLAGVTRKTAAALFGTLLGVALAGIIFQIFSMILHITGYNLDSAESLLLIGQTTGLQLKPLLMVAVLITALGAVMDVAMSISSSLDEIHRLDPTLSAGRLFRSGMNIGKDMVGTMTNTLIMAYTGGALTTMLLLIGYGYGASQLLNSDYLAMEVAQGIASTAGVVLTVPVTAFLSSWIYSGKRIPKADVPGKK